MCRFAHAYQEKAETMTEAIELAGRVAVVIPTYNERENIRPVTARLRSTVPSADVLIVDDNSPDGTGNIADELAAADKHIHVLHRPAKAGLGAAYVAGFEAALDQGYDTIVEMDADGSHQPEELPKLLAALTSADIVLGSRWMPGGKTLNWPKSRELLSRVGNVYARMMLGIPLRDITGGYRAYRASALWEIGLENVESVGYCFQIDLVRRAVQAGLTAAEVPITFVDRTHGASKMSNAIVREALWRVTLWGITRRLRRLRPRIRRRKAYAPELTPQSSAAAAAERSTSPRLASGEMTGASLVEPAEAFFSPRCYAARQVDKRCGRVEPGARIRNSDSYPAP
jgi:dolichol-phosphate mannosyltransferase